MTREFMPGDRVRVDDMIPGAVIVRVKRGVATVRHGYGWELDIACSFLTHLPREEAPDAE